MSAIFYILDIFPGTELYADFRKKSIAEGAKGDFDDIWTQKIEDIMYFESDPDLSQEQVMAFGQKLRASFYENLGHSADAIELTDEKEFYQTHSDFLSRLGMTFSHGDYARNRAIRDKDQIAQRLYEKALGYYPDHRAYLGLGVIHQKNRAYAESVEILSKGVSHFPESESLNMSLGISYMNLEKYAQALPHFLKFERSEQAAYYVNACQKALKN
jgi:tetratricopeptide (TPR) repeat protein